MRKFLGYIFSPLQYLSFLFFLVVFHPIQWISLKLGGYAAHKRSVDILNFFLVSTYYTVGCNVKFINTHQLPLNRSIIFVANHQSMYDISPLIWHLRKYHAKFISKIELTRGIPSISFNLLHGGGANINRKDAKQSISEILKLAGRMRQSNWSAVIFPEGTRTKDGKMKTFAVGGVATLLKKVPNALVVPIAIKGSWELTQFGNYPLRFGQGMSFTVLGVMDQADKTQEQIVEEAERLIKKEVEG